MINRQLYVSVCVCVIQTNLFFFFFFITVGRVLVPVRCCCRDVYVTCGVSRKWGVHDNGNDYVRLGKASFLFYIYIYIYINLLCGYYLAERDGRKFVE